MPHIPYASTTYLENFRRSITTASIRLSSKYSSSTLCSNLHVFRTTGAACECAVICFAFSSSLFVITVVLFFFFFLNRNLLRFIAVSLLRRRPLLHLLALLLTCLSPEPLSLAPPIFHASLHDPLPRNSIPNTASSIPAGASEEKEISSLPPASSSWNALHVGRRSVCHGAMGTHLFLSPVSVPPFSAPSPLPPPPSSSGGNALLLMVSLYGKSDESASGYDWVTSEYSAGYNSTSFPVLTLALHFSPRPASSPPSRKSTRGGMPALPPRLEDRSEYSRRPPKSLSAAATAAPSSASASTSATAPSTPLRPAASPDGEESPAEY
mmetsp:Transcript_19055/g.55349  ORF Transcript_19055/g.55349 Transcript_19055/m.55349 type:complete len:324 (+) Transcript_19055:1463-2434(+)